MTLDEATRCKILALAREIHTLYEEARKRRSSEVCDICNAGDTIGKNGVRYRVRHAVHGYTHRPSLSPYLCHRHASGWAHSHNAYNLDGKRSNEEIDLHFAAYVAKQLAKASVSGSR